MHTLWGTPDMVLNDDYYGEWNEEVRSGFRPVGGSKKGSKSRACVLKRSRRLSSLCPQGSIEHAQSLRHMSPNEENQFQPVRLCSTVCCVRKAVLVRNDVHEAHRDPFADQGV